MTQRLIVHLFSNHQLDATSSLCIYPVDCSSVSIWFQLSSTVIFLRCFSFLYLSFLASYYLCIWNGASCLVNLVSKLVYFVGFALLLFSALSGICTFFFLWLNFFASYYRNPTKWPEAYKILLDVKTDSLMSILIVNSMY